MVAFTSNVLLVEHPNFLGRRTTYLRFQLSNNFKSNIPTVALFNEDFNREGIDLARLFDLL
jgi:hypothetical protein